MAHQDALPLEVVGQAHALILLLLRESHKSVDGLWAVLPQMRFAVSLLHKKNKLRLWFSAQSGVEDLEPRLGTHKNNSCLCLSVSAVRF